MRKSFSSASRSPATAGLLCLLLAASLAGCASKNPLIDDAPVATAATPGAAAGTTAQAAPGTGGVSDTRPTGLRRILGIFSPYRIDVQQGNFVSREMVDELKESMRRNEGVTREQVRFALGTPLLTDVFHADRWDYVFRLAKGNGEVISSRVTVYFDKDRLVRIEGGALPTEKEYLALIAGAAPGAPQPEK